MLLVVVGLALTMPLPIDVNPPVPDTPSDTNRILVNPVEAYLQYLRELDTFHQRVEGCIDKLDDPYYSEDTDDVDEYMRNLDACVNMFSDSSVNDDAYIATGFSGDRYYDHEFDDGVDEEFGPDLIRKTKSQQQTYLMICMARSLRLAYLSW